MLPLSIKDDEYKPAKFNLLVKISGWFRYSHDVITFRIYLSHRQLTLDKLDSQQCCVS